MSCLPESTDLLILMPYRKGPLLDGQSDERLEVLGFGMIETSLPFPYRFSGDAQPRSARPTWVSPILVRKASMICPKA